MIFPRWLVMTITGLVFSIFVTLAIAYLPFESILPQGPEKRIRDWRTYLLSPHAPKQRSDIAVVLITEDSLSRYAYRSPIDRALLSAIVRDLNEAGASAIGLDFIFDRPTELKKDAALLEGIKSSSAPIILGGIDYRASQVKKWSLEFHNDFLKKTGWPVGHLFFGATGDNLTIGDNVIRRSAPVDAGRKMKKSFARLLADVDGIKPVRNNTLIAWQHRPVDETSEIFSTFRIPPHNPVVITEDDSRNDNQILPKAWWSALKGKIVLVGGDLYDSDKHLTPMSVASKQRVPGVIIHANLVAQIRDGRSVHELSHPFEITLVAVLTMIGFLLGWQYQLRRYDLMIGIVGTLAVVGIGALAFWLIPLVVPTSFLAVWLLGVSGGHYASQIMTRDTNE